MFSNSKHSVGMSFQCALTLTNTLVINREFTSFSVDAGFVLALPLHHGDPELDSVGGHLRCCFSSMAIYGRGAYV